MPYRPIPAASSAPTRWLALLLAALLAAAGVVLGIAAPAEAHDQLVSSSPAEGDVLEEAPTEAVLTFSAEIETVGIEMQLTDYHGTILNLPTVPSHDGATVTQQFPELEDGAYTLTWRVVSSDGHPIDGTVSFLVDPGIAATGPGSAPGETAAGIGSESESAPASTAPDMPAWLVIVVGLVGVVVVAGAIIGFMTAASRNDAMRERLASAGPTVSGRDKTDDDDALL